MAKLTIVLGILLVLVAAAGFIATGSSHPTALIPGAVGLLFVLFGSLANTSDSKKRMLWMHIAVTVALLMFLGLIPADINVFRLAHGASFSHPIAIEEKAASSLLCLLFVLLCVRSFINARRQRTLG
ncbi:hypothetical protein [Granulicella arctica]|uniref:Transmembrane protein n=1 Tax=Granulicella arctica TaxID=940613 RepID=A0A7Y9TLT2_9BACT|nr:hypothetical protein [Granulicella arctica]NYF80442.1 hypothetical protein [Granulicella arctica]